MKKLFFVLLCGSGIVLSGCNSKDPSVAEVENDKQASAGSQSQNVTVVSPVTKGDERSPAGVANDQQLTVETPPQVICEKFLAAIRKGDHYSWERLLTKRANNLIRTARVEMQYPGGDRATCSVTGTNYNTNKKDVALVKCYVQEPVNGKMETYEFSYLLRKQNTGWRIAGIWIDINDQGQKDFLSFENSDDVAKIKSMSGESSTTIASEQARKQIK